jgi:hypothetical protein
VLVDVQLVLWKSLIDVTLQVIERKGIAFFVGSIVVLVLNLEALVGQVHVVVLVTEVVLAGSCADVSVPVHVDAEVASYERPDSDVELTRVVKKRLFNVLLHDPEWCLLRSLKDEVIDVFVVTEYLDASSLVQRGRLHEPHVLFAVFDGQALVFKMASVDVSVPVHKLLDASVVRVACYDERGRRRVKHRVVCILSLLVLAVVVVE